MSKVLVTGSQGFIGGYVVEELLGRGQNTVVFQRVMTATPIIILLKGMPQMWT